MIPIREDSRDPKWENIFGATKWAAIRSLSIDFSYSIMKYSPVVVLVGKSCFETFERLLRQDNSIRLVKVLLGVSTRIFGQDACFYVAKDPVSDEIRQLIFLSPHGSRFVFGSTPKEAAYTDLIWNAAAATASIDIVSPDLFGWFTAKTNKDASKITDARRAGGWQELARGVETRRAKGFLELKRGHVTMKAQGYPGLARAREAQRVAGYPELAKARASLAARGNPHMKAAHDANRAKGAEHTKPAMEASKVKCKALRLDRTQVLLNSFDVKYLLHHTPSYYDDNDNAKNTYSLFAELRGWPNLWETFNPRRKAGYKQQLKKAHEYFTTLRNSLDGLLQTRTEDGKKIPHTAYQRKYALWYDKDKHPYGLRWEGDGGLADDNTNGDPNIAISIFWHYETKSLKEQNEFAQLIRDVSLLTRRGSLKQVERLTSYRPSNAAILPALVWLIWLKASTKMTATAATTSTTWTLTSTMPTITAAAARLPHIRLRRPPVQGTVTDRKSVAIVSLDMTVTLTDHSASKSLIPTPTRKTRIRRRRNVLPADRKFIGILC